MDTGTLNFTWSEALVAGFAATGVGHAVISPGSRSTPLALALLRQPGIRCHVVLDERSAAFFALGLAKASRQPALLLATSGTAPANWLPAVIEASQSGVPLILLSADRPPELQGCGANQTVDQVKLFGSHVRAAHALGTPEPGFDAGYLHRLATRAAEQARWPLPGPVHLNIPFREPLLPQENRGLTPVSEKRGQTTISAPPASRPAGPAISRLAAVLSGRPGAIVCGEGDYPVGFAGAVAALAECLDCPILAEPLSNLRFGSHDRSRILCRYDGWLRRREFSTGRIPDWLLRFGAFPVTRSLQAFAAQAREALVLVDPLPRWSDPTHAVTEFLRADPAAVCQALLQEVLQPAPASWMTSFREAERNVESVLARLSGNVCRSSIHAVLQKDALPDSGTGPEAASASVGGDTLFEGDLMPALLARLPADCPVFVGNSMVIRDLDAFGGGGPRPLSFYGNRGASGIDGNVSTALGIAAARGRVVALLGDLTCQHDLGGLAAARGLDAVIVVFNNGGGGIFEYLPQAGLPEFEAGWLTPQALDFRAAAATFGLGYANASRLPDALAAVDGALAAGGPHLVELRIDRQESIIRHRALWQKLAGGGDGK